MMKRIYKYSLLAEPEETIVMPMGAQVLSVHVQRGVIQVWAFVIPDAMPTTYRFVTVMTGHEVPSDAGYFIGTVFFAEDGYAFHVFYSRPIQSYYCATETSTSDIVVGNADPQYLGGEVKAKVAAK